MKKWKTQVIEQENYNRNGDNGMKKGEIYEGIVEKIDFPNKGILMIDGERVVVKNAVPGQKIQCVITKRRKGKSEARVLEVLSVHLLNCQNTHVLILVCAEAAFTRAFLMKHS